MGMYGGGGGGKVEPVITEEMRASAETNAKMWNDYQARIAPFEQKFMADVTREPSATIDKVQGSTNADIQQKLAGATGPASGVDPSRGTPVNTTAMAKGLTSGYVSGESGALDNQANNLSTVVNMGRGEAVESVGTMSDLAESSGRNALEHSISDANSAMNERGATMNLMSTGIGTAGAITAAGGINVGGVGGIFNKVVNADGTGAKYSLNR